MAPVRGRGALPPPGSASAAWVGLVLPVVLAGYSVEEWRRPGNEDCLRKALPQYRVPPAHEDCPEPARIVCEINRLNAGGQRLRHFPHALQHVLPCWSIFQAHVHLDRALVVRTKYARELLQSPWIADLVKLMDATVLLDERGTPFEGCTIKAAFVERARSGWNSCVQWTARDADVVALQHQLHAALPERNASLGRLGVGLLLRRGARRLAYQADIIAMLNRTLSVEDHLSATTFDGVSLLEQARWIRDQDIIITPHGAQNSNFVFARRCTVILELYPRHYYIPGFFLPLARAAGAITFAGYPNWSPLDDLRAALQGHGVIGKARDSTVDVTASELQASLPTLIERSLRCRTRSRGRPTGLGPARG